MSAKTAAEVLEEMAGTYRERNKIYGDNFKTVGAVMEILHGENGAMPASKLLSNAADFNIWHLYELVIVKLTRFANSGLTHIDSIHDASVYCAMIEAMLRERADAPPIAQLEQEYVPVFNRTKGE